MEKALTLWSEGVLGERMVFLGGPRQMDKATMGLSFLPSGAYSEP